MANISEEKKVKKVASTKSTTAKKKTATSSSASTAKKKTATSSSASTAKKKTTTKKVTPKKVETKKAEKVEAVIIEPTEKKKVEERVIVTDKSKQLLPRMAAYVIDMLIIAMLINLLCSISVLNPNHDKYVEATNRYNNYYTNYLENNISVEDFKKNTEQVTYDLYKYGTTNYVIAFVVVIGYLVVFQKYNNGQTIGKRLLKLKVVDKSGKNASLKSYAIRVAPLFLLSYGGIFSIIACILLPQFMTVIALSKWITAVTIASCLLGLIDAEFAIARKDRRSLHDLLSNTKIVSE